MSPSSHSYFRVFFEERPYKQIQAIRKIKGAELLIILLGKRKKDSLLIQNIFIPPQKSSFGYCEVIDYSWAEDLAKSIIGWAHTHPSFPAFHSGTDSYTDRGCEALFEKPFVSITFSRSSYDAIVYTKEGPRIGKLYRRAWVQW